MADFCGSLHGGEGLVEVGDDVGRVFDAAAQAHQVDADAGFLKLLLGELAMRGAGRIQRAAARIGHMRGDGHHLQMVEERGDLLAADIIADLDQALAAVQ